MRSAFRDWAFRNWAFRNWAFDFILVFFLTAILIFPLFQVEYLDNWASIESTFIADARMLADGLKLNGWQPFWYCGTRFDYVYPPGLRFGTAWIAQLFGVSTAQAYHWFTGLFYCLGIAFVYLLARIGSGIRPVGWLSAAGVALLSPAYVLMREFRDDAFTRGWPPMRLHVLMTYGEGPHMSSLAVLGGFLAVAWLGLRRGHPICFMLAPVFAALVVALNFYGATAMAVLFPILVWALWVTHRDGAIFVRAAAIGLLAFGLSAFWLTPAYIRITLDNMRLVSQPGNNWSIALALVVTIVFTALSFRYCYGRTDRAWPLFLAGSVLALSLNVLGSNWFGFRVIGEPHRLVPELDLVLLVAAIYAIWLVWSRPGEVSPYLSRIPQRTLHTAVGVVAGLMLAGSLPYLAKSWRLFPQDNHPEQRIEFRVSDWVAQNMPDSRLYVDGSVRFWYNTRHNLHQVGGGSEQGLSNPALVPSWWDFRMGSDAALSTLWLQATGTDGILVSGPGSQEVYENYHHPEKFYGVLPVIYDSGAGDRIYQTPRRFPERARVVVASAVQAIPPVDTNNPHASLAPYVELIENGPETRVAWARPSAELIRLKAQIADGEAVLVQESFDPAWRAYTGGTPLRLERDPVLGFMLIHAPPGDHEIELVFTLPAGNRLGRWISALTLLILVLWIPLMGLAARFLPRSR